MVSLGFSPRTLRPSCRPDLCAQRRLSRSDCRDVLKRGGHRCRGHDDFDAGCISYGALDEISRALASRSGNCSPTACHLCDEPQFFFYEPRFTAVLHEQPHVTFATNTMVQSLGGFDTLTALISLNSGMPGRFGEVPFELDRIFHAQDEYTIFLAAGTSGSAEPAARFVAHVNGCARTIYIRAQEPANTSSFTECHLWQAG